MNTYWERERSLHERANMVNSAFNKGIEQGKTEGIYEVAIKLLDILDDKTISDKTGLDIETVKKLRKENL